MGQLSPQAPPLSVQGPPKAVRPMSAPRASARCAYCGLYGSLGHCAGCGAPNEPVEAKRLIEVTCYGDSKRRFIEDLPYPAFPPNRVVRR